MNNMKNLHAEVVNKHNQIYKHNNQYEKAKLSPKVLSGVINLSLPNIVVTRKKETLLVGILLGKGLNL